MLPILLYNCEIHGPYLLDKKDSADVFKSKTFKQSKDVKKLHFKICKHILGVQAELGRLFLSVQICTRIAKFWLRIKSPTFDNTLVCKARDICMFRPIFKAYVKDI